MGEGGVSLSGGAGETTQRLCCFNACWAHRNHTGPLVDFNNELMQTQQGGGEGGGEGVSPGLDSCCS